MRKHKFKSGETVTLIATRKQLKSVFIKYSLKPKEKYIVKRAGFGGFVIYPKDIPVYKIEPFFVPETFLK